uniref:Uncharacterized protein n=1 Tax=Oryza glumipatula TaxID=40148 RepID=A0A0D9ZVP4_9ORYZ
MAAPRALLQTKIFYGSNKKQLPAAAGVVRVKVVLTREQAARLVSLAGERRRRRTVAQLVRELRRDGGRRRPCRRLAGDGVEAGARDHLRGVVGFRGEIRETYYMVNWSWTGGYNVHHAGRRKKKETRGYVVNLSRRMKTLSHHAVVLATEY